MKHDRKEDRIEMWKYLKKFAGQESCVIWEGKRAYIFTGDEVSDEILNSYNDDRKRRGVDLLEKSSGILERTELERLTRKILPDVKTLIPCHFLEEGGQVTAFGHGQCFRIPYKKRIGDAVPENLRDEKIFDFADALFGRQVDKKISWASRVFFEDATPEGEVNFETTAKAHPLM